MKSTSLTTNCPSFATHLCLMATVYYSDLHFDDTGEDMREHYALCTDGVLFAITKEYAEERIEDCEWKGPLPMPTHPNQETPCPCHPRSSS